MSPTNNNLITFYKADGTECDRATSKGVKVRLAEVFKKSDQTTLQFMTEMRDLTQGDFDDFRQWFTDAGYAITPA